jgi:phospholipid-transporting ATPase
VLYCKGADNVMFERLSHAAAASCAVLRAHLADFASEGLRTLVLARRDISEDEFRQWFA